MAVPREHKRRTRLRRLIGSRGQANDGNVDVTHLGDVSGIGNRHDPARPTQLELFDSAWTSARAKQQNQRAQAHIVKGHY